MARRIRLRNPNETITDAAWMADAACTGRPSEWFFPDGLTAARFEAGKAVCAVCPVRKECLTMAETLDARDGLWGGLDPDERQRARRARQREARRARA